MVLRRHMRSSQAVLQHEISRVQNTSRASRCKIEVASRQVMSGHVMRSMAAPINGQVNAPQQSHEMYITR